MWSANLHQFSIRRLLLLKAKAKNAYHQQSWWFSQAKAGKKTPLRLDRGGGAIKSIPRQPGGTARQFMRFAPFEDG
jgi:hypothetical protein